MTDTEIDQLDPQMVVEQAIQDSWQVVADIRAARRAELDRFAGMFTVTDTGQWKFDGGTLTEWRIEMSGGGVVCSGFSIESTSAD